MTFDEAVKTISPVDVPENIELMKSIENNADIVDKLKKIAMLTALETITSDIDPINSIYASAITAFTLGVAVGQRMMKSDKEDIAHA
jgi:hypothetical protein